MILAIPTAISRQETQTSAKRRIIDFFIFGLFAVTKLTGAFTKTGDLDHHGRFFSEN
jgi:hypothetical protein